MSSQLAHWLAGGDPRAARRYGLTLKAVCGEVFIPARRVSLADKFPCPACEAIDGPIVGARGNENVAPAGERAEVHYVYRCYARDGDLLYVGATVDPATRKQAHAAKAWWFPKLAHYRLTIYPTRFNAHRVERLAIAAEQPLCNVRHQDFTAWSPERIAKAQALATELSQPAHFARLAKAAGAS